MLGAIMNSRNSNLICLAFAVVLAMIVTPHLQAASFTAELVGGRIIDINEKGEYIYQAFSPVTYHLYLPASAYGLPAGATTLRALDGSNSVRLAALNDSGVVVGESQVDSGPYHMTVWTSGVATEVEPVGSDGTIVTGFNNLGHIVGAMNTNLFLDQHGFIYDGAQFHDLEPPDVAVCTYHPGAVLDINNSDAMIGYWACKPDSFSGDFYYYTWQGTSPTRLTHPTFESGRKINNNNQILGYNFVPNPHTFDMAVLEVSSGIVTKMPQFNGFTLNTEGGFINDLGQVVVYGEEPNTNEDSARAFLWLPGAAYGLVAGIYEVNHLIDKPGFSFVAPEAINNSGQFGCRAYDSSTSNRVYFLLTPIPPPGLTVNSTADGSDISPGDGQCKTASGDCTLRAAIEEANALAGVDTVRFDIPGGGTPVIQPTSPLPEITDPVIINGLTQPTSLQVEIDGSQIMVGDGLVLKSGSSLITGLLINNFHGNGLNILTGDSNTIITNYFGVGPNGQDPRGNSGHGIHISNSKGNIIGIVGNLGLGGNLIANNDGAGIFIESGEGNVLTNNSIYSNGALGIDLAPPGITENDTLDADAGPNGLSNFPIIDSVVSTVFGGGAKIFWGSLRARPATMYQIDCFESNQHDVSNNGEGQHYLGFVFVTTDADGFATFQTGPLPRKSLVAEYNTATATDLNGNTSEFSPYWPHLREVRVFDVDANPLREETFDISHASYDTSSRRYNFDPIGEVTSDTDGVIDLSRLFTSGELSVGDTIQIFKYLNPDETNVRMPQIALDNGRFGPDEYNLIYDTLSGDSLQDIRMDHSTFSFSFRVLIEWDATRAYIDSLTSGIRQMANYLYDVTDGQVVINAVFIDEEQGRPSWEGNRFSDSSKLVEILIVADNSQYTDSRLSYGRTIMPRRFFVSGNAANQSATENPTNPAHIDHWRELARVLGGQLFGFFPERELSPEGGSCDTRTELGFMAWPFPQLGDEGANSEMSWSRNYEDIDCRGTRQYRINGASCWDFLEQKFERKYPNFLGIMAPVIKPDERFLIGDRQYLLGPNNYSDLTGNTNLQVNVGADIFFFGDNFPSPAFDEFWEFTDIESAPLAGIEVVVKSSTGMGSLDYIETIQGETSDDGNLWLVGIEDGDQVVASGGQFTSTVDSSGAFQPVLRWINGEAIVTPPGGLAAGGDASHTLILSPIAGDFPLIVSADLDSVTFDLRMDVSRTFASLPTAIYTKGATGLVSADFTLNTLLYQGSIDFGLNQTGQIAVNAVDDSLNGFSFTTRYSLSDGIDTLTPNIAVSDDGSAEFDIDAVNTGIERMLVVSSPFPIIRGTLNPLSIQAGNTHALSIYPATSLQGANRLVLKFNRNYFSGLTGIFDDPQSLKIHHWNTTTQNWDLITSEVDTLRSEVSATISETGVYAAFTSAFSSAIGDDGNVTLPRGFELYQSYPNPFNPSTSISFKLPAPSHVKLEIFNILGQAVATLYNGPLQAGVHRYTWDGTNASSGVYLYRLTAGDYVESKKMILLK